MVGEVLGMVVVFMDHSMVVSIALLTTIIIMVATTMAMAEEQSHIIMDDAQLTQITETGRIKTAIHVVMHKDKVEVVYLVLIQIAV